MTSSSIILYCILSAALLFLYLHHHHTCIHHPPLHSQPHNARISRRVLSAYFNRGNNIEIQKSKVHDEEIHGSKDQEGYAEVEYLTSESGDELIYHVDYHGVTTHPYPAPKHPIQKKKKKKAATRPLKSDAPSSP